MTSTAWVKLADAKNTFAELLPVAAVFKHPLNKDNTPGYYSDVIIHVDGKLVLNAFEKIINHSRDQLTDWNKLACQSCTVV